MVHRVHLSPNQIILNHGTPPTYHLSSHILPPRPRPTPAQKSFQRKISSRSQTLLQKPSLTLARTVFQKAKLFILFGSNSKSSSFQGEVKTAHVHLGSITGSYTIFIAPHQKKKTTPPRLLSSSTLAGRTMSPISEAEDHLRFHSKSQRKVWPMGVRLGDPTISHEKCTFLGASFTGRSWISEDCVSTGTKKGGKNFRSSRMVPGANCFPLGGAHQSPLATVFNGTLYSAREPNLMHT